MNRKVVAHPYQSETLLTGLAPRIDSKCSSPVPGSPDNEPIGFLVMHHVGFSATHFGTHPPTENDSIRLVGDSASGFSKKMNWIMPLKEGVTYEQLITFKEALEAHYGPALSSPIFVKTEPLELYVTLNGIQFIHAHYPLKESGAHRLWVTDDFCVVMSPELRPIKLDIPDDTGLSEASIQIARNQSLLLSVPASQPGQNPSHYVDFLAKKSTHCCPEAFLEYQLKEGFIVHLATHPGDFCRLLQTILRDYEKGKQQEILYAIKELIQKKPGLSGQPHFLEMCDMAIHYPLIPPRFEHAFIHFLPMMTPFGVQEMPFVHENTPTLFRSFARAILQETTYPQVCDMMLYPITQALPYINEAQAGLQLMQAHQDAFPIPFFKRVYESLHQFATTQMGLELDCLQFGNSKTDFIALATGLIRTLRLSLQAFVEFQTCLEACVVDGPHPLSTPVPEQASDVPTQAPYLDQISNLNRLTQELEVRPLQALPSILELRAMEQQVAVKLKSIGKHSNPFNECLENTLRVLQLRAQEILSVSKQRDEQIVLNSLKTFLNKVTSTPSSATTVDACVHELPEAPHLPEKGLGIWREEVERLYAILAQQLDRYSGSVSAENIDKIKLYKYRLDKKILKSSVPHHQKERVKEWESQLAEVAKLLGTVVAEGGSASESISGWSKAPLAETEKEWRPLIHAILSLQFGYRNDMRTYHRHTDTKVWGRWKVSIWNACQDLIRWAIDSQTSIQKAKEAAARLEKAKRAFVQDCRPLCVSLKLVEDEASYTSLVGTLAAQTSSFNESDILRLGRWEQVRQVVAQSASIDPALSQVLRTLDQKIKDMTAQKEKMDKALVEVSTYDDHVFTVLLPVVRTQKDYTQTSLEYVQAYRAQSSHDAPIASTSELEHALRTLDDLLKNPLDPSKLKTHKERYPSIGITPDTLVFLRDLYVQKLAQHKKEEALVQEHAKEQEKMLQAQIETLSSQLSDSKDMPSLLQMVQRIEQFQTQNGPARRLVTQCYSQCLAVLADPVTHPIADILTSLGRLSQLPEPLTHRLTHLALEHVSAIPLSELEPATIEVVENACAALVKKEPTPALCPTVRLALPFMTGEQIQTLVNKMKPLALSQDPEVVLTHLYLLLAGDTQLDFPIAGYLKRLELIAPLAIAVEATSPLFGRIQDALAIASCRVEKSKKSKVLSAWTHPLLVAENREAELVALVLNPARVHMIPVLLHLAGNEPALPPVSPDQSASIARAFRELALDPKACDLLAMCVPPKLVQAPFEQGVLDQACTDISPRFGIQNCHTSFANHLLFWSYSADILKAKSDLLPYEKEDQGPIPESVKTTMDDIERKLVFLRGMMEPLLDSLEQRQGALSKATARKPEAQLVPHHQKLAREFETFSEHIRPLFEAMILVWSIQESRCGTDPIVLIETFGKKVTFIAATMDRFKIENTERTLALFVIAALKVKLNILDLLGQQGSTLKHMTLSFEDLLALLEISSPAHQELAQTLAAAVKKLSPYKGGLQSREGILRLSTECEVSPEIFPSALRVCLEFGLIPPQFELKGVTLPPQILDSNVSLLDQILLPYGKAYRRQLETEVSTQLSGLTRDPLSLKQGFHIVSEALQRGLCKQSASDRVISSIQSYLSGIDVGAVTDIERVVMLCIEVAKASPGTGDRVLPQLIKEWKNRLRAPDPERDQDTGNLITLAVAEAHLKKQPLTDALPNLIKEITRLFLGLENNSFRDAVGHLLKKECAPLFLTVLEQGSPDMYAALFAKVTASLSQLEAIVFMKEVNRPTSPQLLHMSYLDLLMRLNLLSTEVLDRLFVRDALNEDQLFRVAFTAYRCCPALLDQYFLPHVLSLPTQAETPETSTFRNHILNYFRIFFNPQSGAREIVQAIGLINTIGNSVHFGEAFKSAVYTPLILRFNRNISNEEIKKLNALKTRMFATRTT